MDRSNKYRVPPLVPDVKVSQPVFARPADELSVMRGDVS
jgi:hypothetical protein